MSSNTGWAIGREGSVKEGTRPHLNLHSRFCLFYSVDFYLYWKNEFTWIWKQWPECKEKMKSPRRHLYIKSCPWEWWCNPPGYICALLVPYCLGLSPSSPSLSLLAVSCPKLLNGWGCLLFPLSCMKSWCLGPCIEDSCPNVAEVSLVWICLPAQQGPALCSYFPSLSANIIICMCVYLFFICPHHWNAKLSSTWSLPPPHPYSGPRTPSCYQQ